MSPGASSEPDPKRQLTALLTSAAAGCEQDRQELLERVYAELRRIAAAQLRSGPQADDLQPTMLVHDVFLRLVDEHRVDWESRAHFFGIAAKAMRELIVQTARRDSAQKRGGDRRRVELDAMEVASEDVQLDVVELSEALDQLELVDAESARIVELRFFAGLGREQTAELVGISPATLDRRWSHARDWLRQRMAEPGS